MRTPKAWKSDSIKVIEWIAYYLAISAAIWVFWFVLSRDLLQTRGGDVNIFCLAGQSIRHGRNPYLAGNLGPSDTWNYLPVFAYGFRLLCSRFNFQNTYIFFYFPFLLFAMELWIKGKSWLYGVILCVSGLYSFGWVIFTGNISVLEFYLLSLSALLFFRKKYALAFFLLGLNASVKIIPMLYFPVFLLLMEQTNQRRKTFLWIAAGFLLPFLISAVFAADLIPWYFKQLLGLIPNQHSAFNEYNSFHFTNPLFISFIVSILGVGEVIKTNFFIAILGFILGMGSLYVLWRQVEPKIQSARKLEIAFSVGIIIATLLMPRLKPYSFLPALLFFYVASRDQPRWLQGVYLILLSILPNLLSYAYKYDISISVLEELPGFLIKPFEIIQTFNQPFFLILAIIIFALSIRNTIFQTDDQNSEAATI